MTGKLFDVGCALILMQDINQLIKQKEECKDVQLKQTVVDMTESFKAENITIINRFEAENTKTINRFEAEIAETIRKFEAEATERARSVAEVRLTKVLVLAAAGFHSCWGLLDPCSGSEFM